ncbi:MAG: glycosyltransferase [Bacteroidota bacterium]
MHRVCKSLTEQGYEVHLVGRIRYNSRPLHERPYRTHRMRLFFDRGKMFYLEFTFRLFWYLIFKKCDILLSNDLDTLFPNFMVAKFRRKRLLYDSHELWTEIPELLDRPTTRKVWHWLEKRLFKRLKYAYTVNQSIADFYKEKYGVNVQSVRNLPLRKPAAAARKGPEKVLLYQGALNTGRGIEMMIEAMKFMPDYRLIVVGFGTEEEVLPEKAKAWGVAERVDFRGYVAFQDLHAITQEASLGFSLEEDRGLSYRFALPNKLTDYVQAGVPVIVSDLPEMRRMVEEHGLGEMLPAEARNAEALANLVRGVMENEEKWLEYHRNCLKAAEELCWEKEEKKLLRILEAAQAKSIL